MTGDDEPLELRLARAARAEAEQLRKAAERDLEAVRYERGQIEHAKRLIEQTEAGIRKREEALRKAGEPDFVARMAAADKALADAQKLMRNYDKDKHAAMISLQQIDEHEKAAAA
jgi:hypothetical protein